VNVPNAVALPSVSTSDSFFDVFQVKPLLGRTFAAGEELELKDQHELEDALKCFEVALELHPNNITTIANRRLCW